MTARRIFPKTRYALRGAAILACIFFSMPFLEGYPFLFALKFGSIASSAAFVGFFALFHSVFISVSSDKIIFFQFFFAARDVQEIGNQIHENASVREIANRQKRRQKACIRRPAFRRKGGRRTNPQVRVKVALGKHRQKRRSPQDRAFFVSGKAHPISRQPISKAPPRRTRTSTRAACLCLSAHP